MAIIDIDEGMCMQSCRWRVHRAWWMISSCPVYGHLVARILLIENSVVVCKCNEFKVIAQELGQDHALFVPRCVQDDNRGPTDRHSLYGQRFAVPKFHLFAKTI